MNENEFVNRRKRSTGLVLSDEEDQPEEEEESERDDEQPEQPAKPLQPVETKKTSSDVDDIWASLNKKPSPSSSTSAAAPAAVTTPSKSSSVDDIWAALNAKKPAASSPATQGSAQKPALQSTPTTKLGIPASWLQDSPAPVIPSAPSSTVAAPTDSTEAKDAKKTITITEKYDFAGETITLTKEVSVDAIKPGKGRGGAPNVPASGLGNILADMKGKKKMSALQKSALDWQGVREKDEEVKAELDKNKKDGYLEKQAFLSRADWRQFENERDERSKGRRTSSGGGSGGL